MFSIPRFPCIIKWFAKKAKKHLTKEHLFYIIPLQRNEGATMYLTESDLNRIGQDIVRSYSQKVFAPVDIDDLLKKLLNISVEDYTLHPRGLILGIVQTRRCSFL